MNTRMHMVVEYLLNNQIQFRLENDGEAQSYLWIVGGLLIMNDSDSNMTLYYKGLELCKWFSADLIIQELNRVINLQSTTDRLEGLTKEHGM